MRSTLIETAKYIGPKTEMDESSAAGVGVRALLPVYREGAVIAGAEGISTEQAASVTRELESIGDAIATDERAAIAAIGGTKFQVTEEKIVTRIDENPIIDFPNYSFWLDGFWYSNRSCVTVCSKERNSKVWTRSRLKIGSNMRQEQLPPDEAARFFHLSTTVSAEVMKRLQGRYFEVVGRHTGFSELRPAHRIVLKALDLDSDLARRFLSHIVFGDPLSDVANSDEMKSLWSYFVRAFSQHQLGVADGVTSSELKVRLCNWQPWIVETAEDAKAFCLAHIEEDSSMFLGFSRHNAADKRRGTADGVSVKLINAIGKRV